MTTTDRTEYVAGLRQLADLLEQHDELPLPHEGRKHAPMTFYFLSGTDPKAKMVAAVRALPVPLLKGPRDDNYFDLNGTLHGLTIRLCAYRAAVCERVVVGTETVETVEWRCSPLLSGGAS
jgi:hypothetical protein